MNSSNTFALLGGLLVLLPGCNPIPWGNGEYPDCPPHERVVQVESKHYAQVDEKTLVFGSILPEIQLFVHTASHAPYAVTGLTCKKTPYIRFEYGVRGKAGDDELFGHYRQSGLVDEDPTVMELFLAGSLTTNTLLELQDVVAASLGEEVEDITGVGIAMDLIKNTADIDLNARLTSDPSQPRSIKVGEIPELVGIFVDLTDP